MAYVRLILRDPVVVVAESRRHCDRIKYRLETTFPPSSMWPSFKMHIGSRPILSLLHGLAESTIVPKPVFWSGLRVFAYSLMSSGR